MADLFISYAQQDRDWVERLVAALSAEGWDVWWDLEIRAGERFDRAIERTLQQVQAVVAVWSEHSVDSDWVRDEAAWALENDKLLTLRIEGRFSLPLKFSQVHAHSMAHWDGSGDDPRFRKLVADIVQIAGPPPARAPSAAAAVSPASRAVPVPEPDVAPEVPSSPNSSAQPATGAAPRPSPEPRQAPTEPEPSSRATRRGVVVGAVSLAAAALVGVLFLVRTTDEPPPGDKPSASVAEQAQTVPAPDADLSAPISAPGQSERPQLSVFRDRLEDGSQGPEMVVIPAGQLRMGCVSGKGCYDDELPVRTVGFDAPFAIGRHEVTFAEYDRFAEATGAQKPKDRGWGRGRRPVIEVSWDDAVAYAAWLSDQTGKRYRLPSEAEWEYAARAGTTTPFSTGTCIDTEQANYDGNYAWKECPKTGVYKGQTVEVGTLPANPWKLHEVHGNVREWVQDCWHESYEDAPDDGSAWQEEGRGNCGRRVVRGGSWGGRPGALRSAGRDGGDTGFGSDFLGFRLARDL